MSVYITEDHEVVTRARQVRLDHNAFATRLRACMLAMGFGEDDTVVQVGFGALVKIAGVRTCDGRIPVGWKRREDAADDDDIIVPDHSTDLGASAGRIFAALGDVPSLRQVLEPFGMPAILHAVQIGDAYRQLTPAVDLYEDRMVIVKWKGIAGLEELGQTVGAPWQRTL